MARAAGIGGGRVHRRQTPWTYYGIIALIVVLGVVGTISSRQRRDSQINSAGNSAPTVGTVWQEAYEVYACGKWVPAISTKAPDPQGITTRQAGIINIDPTTKASAGKNATLGKFADAVGMKLNAATLQVPGGHLYQDGNTCEGKPGHVFVKEFAGTTDTIGQVYNGAKGQLPKLDPAQIPLKNDYMLTIAFVPSSDATKIPPPETSVISALQALQAKQQAQQQQQQSSSSSTPSIATTPATNPPSSATSVKPSSTATSKP